MRKLIVTTVSAAALAVTFGSGYALHSQASVPAPCHVAGSQLPSGDAIKVDAAGNGWTVNSKVSGPFSEFVCTDGTLVRVTGYGNPAPAVTVHHVSLRYNPDGVQMTCPRSELGWTATISGDGKPFAARCDSDGRIDVWDATS